MTQTKPNMRVAPQKQTPSGKRPAVVLNSTTGAGKSRKINLYKPQPKTEIGPTTPRAPTAEKATRVVNW
jgi:hypothetical protein